MAEKLQSFLYIKDSLKFTIYNFFFHQVIEYI